MKKMFAKYLSCIFSKIALLCLFVLNGCTDKVYLYDVIIENDTDLHIILNDINSATFVYPKEIKLFPHDKYIYHDWTRGATPNIDYFNLLPLSLTLSIADVDIPMSWECDDIEWNLCRGECYTEDIGKLGATFTFTFTDEIVRSLLDAAKEE